MKEKLHQAGLGHKKVCFNWEASAVDVKTKLEEVFPKLSNSGGFDILRCGQQTSELVLINPPKSGYNVLFLRDSGGLGQAVALIRPIQNNLDMAPVAMLETSEVSLHCRGGGRAIGRVIIGGGVNIHIFMFCPRSFFEIN